MPKSHWFLASTHSTFNLIGPCHRHPNTQGHKARTIHTLRPLTYELFFQKSSIMVCVCVVDHYHIRVEIHQMAQTHKKVNKIHSVEIRSLTTDACIHMKRTHHLPSDTPLNLLGFIFTRMIPSSDCTRGYSIHLTQNIGIISNTCSQGELSYRASSLHVAFMTAQKVTLTIPWCRAKWNYRQRESTTQRLCASHALTSASLAMHRKWRSS